MPCVSISKIPTVFCRATASRIRTKSATACGRGPGLRATDDSMEPTLDWASVTYGYASWPASFPEVGVGHGQLLTDLGEFAGEAVIEKVLPR